MASGNVAARDGVFGSLILIGSWGAGLLRFRTLLENTFHRRIYLILMLIMSQNLGQRLLGWKLGWLMRQLIPFEMIVWAGGMAMMSLLGLRPLRFLDRPRLGGGGSRRRAVAWLSARADAGRLPSHRAVHHLAWARAGQGSADSTAPVDPRPQRHAPFPYRASRARPAPSHSGLGRRY